MFGIAGEGSAPAGSSSVTATDQPGPSASEQPGPSGSGIPTAQADRRAREALEAIQQLPADNLAEVGFLTFKCLRVVLDVCFYGVKRWCVTPYSAQEFVVQCTGLAASVRHLM